ncbi:MAG: helix-turn-helix transcriptional regulator [bacterium]|nr:helix-turn-helix transcriptional regulator [bacterium]
MAEGSTSDIKGLGARLRARRTALGLTLAQVAEEAELSLPYVSNLERGRGNPTLDALRSLARALDQSLADILGDTESETNFDPMALVLAEAPQSLRQFVQSDRFKSTIDRLSEAQGVPAGEMRERLMVGMASAPRRSSGEPTEEDWRRLLDAYSLILGDE